MEQFDKTGMITSTQLGQPDDLLKQFDDLGNPLISDATRIALENTGDITVLANGEGDEKVKLENTVVKLESEILAKKGTEQDGGNDASER